MTVIDALGLVGWITGHSPYQDPIRPVSALLRHVDYFPVPRDTIRIRSTSISLSAIACLQQQKTLKRGPGPFKKEDSKTKTTILIRY